MPDENGYQQHWAALLEAAGCSRLAHDMLTESPIGQQGSPVGSLDGRPGSNILRQALHKLASAGLKGKKTEYVRRMVDLVLPQANGIYAAERDALAYLLERGEIEVVIRVRIPSHGQSPGPISSNGAKPGRVEKQLSRKRECLEALEQRIHELQLKKAKEGREFSAGERVELQEAEEEARGLQAEIAQLEEQE